MPCDDNIHKVPLNYFVIIFVFVGSNDSSDDLSFTTHGRQTCFLARKYAVLRVRPYPVGTTNLQNIIASVKNIDKKKMCMKAAQK